MSVSDGLRSSDPCLRGVSNNTDIRAPKVSSSGQSWDYRPTTEGCATNPLLEGNANNLTRLPSEFCVIVITILAADCTAQLLPKSTEQLTVEPKRYNIPRCQASWNCITAWSCCMDALDAWGCRQTQLGSQIYAGAHQDRSRNCAAETLKLRGGRVWQAHHPQSPCSCASPPQYVRSALPKIRKSQPHPSLFSSPLHPTLVVPRLPVVLIPRSRPFWCFNRRVLHHRICRIGPAESPLPTYDNCDDCQRWARTGVRSQVTVTWKGFPVLAVGDRGERLLPCRARHLVATLPYTIPGSHRPYWLITVSIPSSCLSHHLQSSSHAKKLRLPPPTTNPSLCWSPSPPSVRWKPTTSSPATILAACHRTTSRSISTLSRFCTRSPTWSLHHRDVFFCVAATPILTWLPSLSDTPTAAGFKRTACHWWRKIFGSHHHCNQSVLQTHVALNFTPSRSNARCTRSTSATPTTTSADPCLQDCVSHEHHGRQYGEYECCHGRTCRRSNAHDE